jgi:hypothetical protein
MLSLASNQGGARKMYKNFRIYRTETGTFILKADSKRFGKQAIIFEHYDCNAVVKYMLENYTNKDGKRIKNMRWTDLVYRKAMSTCNIPNNPWYTA